MTKRQRPDKVYFKSPEFVVEKFQKRFNLEDYTIVNALTTQPSRFKEGTIYIIEKQVNHEVVIYTLLIDGWKFQIDVLPTDHGYKLEYCMFDNINGWYKFTSHESMLAIMKKSLHDR